MRAPSSLLLALVVALPLLTGCTADLRTAALTRDGVSAEQRRTGHAALTQLADAHGGRQAWIAQEAVRVELVDTWNGWLMTTFGMPWEFNGAKLRVTMRPGSADSRIEFLDGEWAGTAWGIQQWVTYTVDEEGRLAWEDDGDIRFWLPTVTYFVEAPLRLVEADVVAALPPETIAARTYDRVFLSWSRAEPQDEIDQYVAWIDRETGRLSYLQYTIRDYGSFMEGCMRYSDYAEVGGFWLARSMTVVDGPGGEPALHRMEVASVDVDIDLPPDFLMPDLKRRASKHD